MPFLFQNSFCYLYHYIVYQKHSIKALYKFAISAGVPCRQADREDLCSHLSGIFFGVPFRNGVSMRLKNVSFLNESQTTFFTAFEDEDSKKDDGISFSLQSGPAWAGSERDYTYDEVMFKRLFKNIFHTDVHH